MEAIILAGGLGTRLRAAVPDLPKCLAPVGGRPFLAYVTSYFQRAGVSSFIFALGYKSDYFDQFFQEYFPAGGYAVSLEDEPLGTGGAIRRALGLATGKTVLVMNGDTFFRVSASELVAFHESGAADCTLSLRPMRDFDRFGVVELDASDRVVSFREKQYYTAGLINGGVYAVDRAHFLAETLPEKFSFEKDYLEAYYTRRRVLGLVQDTYFIDIGIPEDYSRVQEETNQLL